MSEPKLSSVEVNHVVLSVGDWGGHGSPVLFAHPTGFLGAVWQPVIESLRERGFAGRILTYDQRGHGRSSKPDSGYEWSNFIDDLDALMEKLGLTAVLGVGHSGGATTLAGVSAGRRERFRRLLLIDPILFDPVADRALRSMENPMAARTRNRRLVWSSRAEIFESFRCRPPYDTWTEQSLRAYVEQGTFVRPDGEVELWCPGRIEAQVYEHATGINGFEFLSRLCVPVLLVRGEMSFSFPEQRARRAMQELSAGRLIAIEGTTHFVPMEKPEKIAQLILAEIDA